MTTQLLIYETVVPLSAARHHGCAIETKRNYEFSGKTNSVPLMAVEFPHAVSEYAIVFAGNKESIMPAVILGVREGENLFLSRDAKWDAKYVPAFVRRYPFVFSTSADGDRLILCIDEAYSGFNREARGQELFDADHKPTQYVQNVLTFLQEYQAQFNRTVAFCKKVLELDLLEPMQAQVETTAGEKLSLAGFMAVNREKLKALSGEKLAELAKSDALELLYLHLQSMRNFQALPSRLSVIKGGTPEAPSSGDATADDRLNGSRASA
ncbi:SapC family protein [Bradyrhizobium tropiciagri]|uniref:SapC family protein n=1 Tax=Bradyrhizobium tropiciagri TaxID=312253 RepID=UPI001BACE951|nr:SapC family protein [Bradyrhizobium tropiciagri]MBR0897681.1 SapC family protein [Bradyrhizobium tropiciagri]